MEQNCYEELKSINRNSLISERMKRILCALLSFPKTVYVNFRLFPMNIAVRLPIIISYRVKIIELHKGTIRINGNAKRFMIKIGFGGSEGIIERKGSLCLEKGSVLNLSNNVVLSAGISIRNSGVISIGNNFFCNRNCTIWANDQIFIGEDALFGWNITLRDCDGHFILSNKKVKQSQKPIIIGKHSWICSETHMLKGAEVGDNCVVGYRSLVTGEILGDNLLIVGQPAKAIQENINWIHG